MSSKRPNSPVSKVMEDDVFDAISAGIAPDRTDAGRKRRLHARVMSRLGFDTIHADEGEWREIMPQVFKKTLQVDKDRGIESFLLRMEAGSRIPAHHHDHDELCCVIDGDLAFGDLQLRSGDYHFAYRDSQHQDATSVHGCLLFLQSGIAGAYRAR